MFPAFDCTILDPVRMANQGAYPPIIKTRIPEKRIVSANRCLFITFGDLEKGRKIG